MLHNRNMCDTYKDVARLIHNKYGTSAVYYNWRLDRTSQTFILVWRSPEDWYRLSATIFAPLKTLSHEWHCEGTALYRTKSY